MDKYIKGFLQLQIHETKFPVYCGPEKTASQIQKCSILKSTNVSYSTNVEIIKKHGEGSLA